MKFDIFENGCKDQEIMLLDTKLPYFFSNISRALESKAEIEIHIAGSKEEFAKLSGMEPKGKCAHCSENKIVIFAPNKFEAETHHERNEFYRILYNQLFHALYNSGN
tara:strand:- start:1346 stop:1666 length:321 start_codon:yes stop_codon:yes gene_type:complete